MKNKGEISALIEQLNSSGAISFVPIGHSMWPTLKNKGQAVIVAKKTGRLNVLDVALFVHEKAGLVLHRVLRVTPDGYITCGDSQFTTEIVKEENVLGVMTGFYVKEKYIDVSSPKYVKKIERWYKRKKIRKFKIKRFYFSLSIKAKIKRIFIKKGKENV